MLIFLLIVLSTNNEIILRNNQDLFYSYIVNNFISYQNFKLVESDKDYFFSGNFESEVFIGSKNYILESYQKYNITFELSNISFPDTNIILIEFRWRMLSKTTNRIDTLISDDNLDSIIYTNDSVYYKYHNRKKFSFPNLKSSTLHRYDCKGGYQLNDKGLLGYNKRTKEVLFISGYFFLTNISDYFFKQGITESNLIDFINIRYHCYEPSIIEINTKKQTAIFFSERYGIHYRIYFKKNKRFNCLMEFIEEINLK